MVEKTYKHIFFDLDNTLWDFDTNSTKSLELLFNKFNLNEKGNITFPLFHKTYIIFNQHLWRQYRKSKITKDYLKTERFYRTLKHFKVLDYDLAYQLSEEYLELSAEQRQLMPHTLEVLSYLEKKYQLHIITNGFLNVQLQKLEHSKIRKFFDIIITSESANCKKPDAKIFYKALQEANATKDESIMIGDNSLTDIRGAMEFGIDQVFYNPKKIITRIKPTYVINDLIEIKQFL